LISDGIGRVGSQLGVVTHAVDAAEAIVRAVGQNPVAIAGIVDLAVAVEVAEVLAVLALDQVDQVLCVQLLVGEVSLDLCLMQELRVAQHLFGLVAQSEHEARAVRRRRDADQHMSHMDQRLRG
jgi:hypothetical protein